MPKLNTYTSQFQGFPISGGRRADAQDFGGGVAGATGELARTASKVGEAVLSHQEETESRRALVGSTEIRAKYARELDAAVQTGADTAAIKEKMEADLAKVGEDFQTEKGVSSLAMHSANTTLMFDEQANRIEVQRAAANAQLEAQRLTMADSAILINNPLYLPAAEANVDALMATFKRISPEQKAEMAMKLKQNLNMSAAVSYARIDPETAKKKLEAGEWTLTGEQRALAVGKANDEIAGRRAEENYRYTQEQRRIKELDEKARDKHFVDIVEGRGSWKAIRDDSDLQPATREHLRMLLEKAHEEAANGPKHSNPVVYRDLWLRAHAPEGDQNRMVNADPIFAAVRAGQLKISDADKLNSAVANARDENYRSFGSRLNGRINTVAAAMRASPQYAAQPELSAAIQIELVQQVERKAGDMRRAGQDPTALLNPESKDYFFTPGIIKTVAADVQRQVAAALPQPPSPKTKEEYDAIAPGTVYIDTDGVQKRKGKGGTAPATTAPTAEQVLSERLNGFITKHPRGGFSIDAPARSPARALNGQTFNTREEAMGALQELYK